jgi:hypothetical protein
MPDEFGNPTIQERIAESTNAQEFLSRISSYDPRTLDAFFSTRSQFGDLFGGNDRFVQFFGANPGD